MTVEQCSERSWNEQHEEHESQDLDKSFEHGTLHLIPTCHRESLDSLSHAACLVVSFVFLLRAEEAAGSAERRHAHNSF